MSVKPYSIHVPQEILDDLDERLARTRWSGSTGDITDDRWSYGTSPAFLRGLIEHWRQHFDWRAQEDALNRFAHFRAEVDGFGIHFIHERGRGPRPMPLLLTHGFPDSFVRFLKIIPMLTDPAANGGDAADAFDVIVPSLPGFGFSDKPSKPGFTFHVGDLWHRLMTAELGYERFAAHGGDWGTTITEQLARSHARSLLAIHLTDVPFWHLFHKPDNLSRYDERGISLAQPASTPCAPGRGTFLF